MSKPATIKKEKDDCECSDPEYRETIHLTKEQLRLIITMSYGDDMKDFDEVSFEFNDRQELTSKTIKNYIL